MNTPEPCINCKYLYCDCMQKDNPDYESQCSKFRCPINGECPEFDEDIRCYFCSKAIDRSESHINMGRHVCESCKDKWLEPEMHCKFCGASINPKTAHLHQGSYVGDECCWDERLRITE